MDLARDLIRLSGLEVGRDIDIEYIGARPGEKLCEELFADGEVYERTQHEKVLVVRNGAEGQGSKGAGEQGSTGAGERRGWEDKSTRKGEKRKGYNTPS